MREIKQRRWGTRVPHRLMEDFRARRCNAAERIALRRVPVGMTKNRKKRKAPAASRRPKTANKRKQMTARAAELAATRPVPMTDAKKPSFRLPLVFWPLEVLRWWTPSAGAR
jgi:hypothetical protein